MEIYQQPRNTKSNARTCRRIAELVQPSQVQAVEGALNGIERLFAQRATTEGEPKKELYAAAKKALDRQALDTFELLVTLGRDLGKAPFEVIALVSRTLGQDACQFCTGIYDHCIKMEFEFAHAAGLILTHLRAIASNKNRAAIPPDCARALTKEAEQFGISPRTLLKVVELQAKANGYKTLADGAVLVSGAMRDTESVFPERLLRA